MTTALWPGAREYVWEMAHHETPAGNNLSCNGRTIQQRQAPHGANGGLAVSSTGTFANMTAVVDIWKASAALCPILMTTSSTQASTAVAHDAMHGFAIWFK